MKKNLGTPDKVIRFIVAAIFAVLYFTGTVSGTFGLVLLVLGIVFAMTALLNFCPIYAIFGMSTCQKK